MTSAVRVPITFNARGLGGLPTEDGAVTAPVLYRSDSLSALTEQGLLQLAELGIGTVVDLRTDGERQRAADILPADGSVRLLALSIQGGAMDEMVQKLLPSDAGAAALTDAQITEIVDQVPTLDDLYLAILASSPAQFAVLARAVIDATGSERPAVLFHCTAGKDRTGLAAALLLAVAGVPRSEIVADYVRTEANLAGPFAQQLTALITAIGIPLTPRLETLATRSPESAITAALDWIAREHGTAIDYLMSGGLTAAEAERLRGALVSADAGSAGSSGSNDS
ncbi:tyrosine-protein phosphatase [Microbacterium sp. AGC85]